MLGGIVDTGSQHQTDGDAELVSRDKSTTDLTRSNLRHIQNDDGRNKTNTETSNQTASYQQADGGRSSLENDTDHEDNTTRDDSSTTTKPIGEVTGNQSTKEGTSGEDGRDQRLVR